MSTPANNIFGTPFAPHATRLMLLGAGELGKEVAIEAQRYGIEVIAVDRYANAPAMQIAQRAYVINMQDAAALRALIGDVQPHFIVPEIEAIATAVLYEVENQFTVIPNARAVNLTMQREGIRRLAAEELQLPTSPYQFAGSEAECVAAIRAIGTPCVVKPVMSSSGKGQSTVRDVAQAAAAWQSALAGSRGVSQRVIVEGFIEFDYEITLLTVRHVNGTTFCAPIGHLQIDGDYRESWQPQAMSARALARSQDIAKKVTGALGGQGLFGVELFVRGDEVWFSEVSPRPHDTGLVTLISQDQSEFALHVRALLGLPVHPPKLHGAAASCALLVTGHSADVRFDGVAKVLREPDTGVRLFGKPEVRGHRRMGVALALANDVDSARAKARRMVEQISVAL